MTSIISMLNAEETQRYARHFSLPQVGAAGQLKLRDAKVLCIGAGGLGSAVLLYLAAAGVGTLGIVDDDYLELSNLQRQILYQTSDVGQNKASVAQAKLQALNPQIKIAVHNQRLTVTNALEIIKSYDIVVDGSDNFNTRYIVNEACFRLKKANVYASIAGFYGQCSIFTAANGPCYRCVFEQIPDTSMFPSCSAGGVLGVLPGMLGTIQANEVLKLILGIGKPLIGRLLQLDSLHMKFTETHIPINVNCQLCSQPIANDSMVDAWPASCLSENDGSLCSITTSEFYALKGHDRQLLDVRDYHEHQQANLGGKNIPLAELESRMDELNRNMPIVIYCENGPRSCKAAMLLQALGFSSVRYLTGGMNLLLEKR